MNRPYLKYLHTIICTALILVPQFSHGIELEIKDYFFICPMTHIQRFLKKTEPLKFDKLVHCATSCMLAQHCSPLTVYKLGLLKELTDIFGPGTPDMEDLKANLKGIQLSKQVFVEDTCIDLCEELYPRKNHSPINENFNE